MAPSRKSLSVAIGVLLLLLLVIVAADEMASVAPLDTCRHLSGGYQGVCRTNESCRLHCLAESADNIGGACDDRGFLGFLSQCWCFTNCG
ncbi:hypothetical protein BS78_04G041900 [Paspalum vaginatum]|nr:hypothetical protein BS78_04G041900 [Paspalum vaginatum]